MDRELGSSFTFIATGRGTRNELLVLGLDGEDGLPNLTYQDSTGVWNDSGRLLNEYHISWSDLTTGKDISGLPLVFGLGHEDGLPYLIKQDEKGVWHDAGRLVENYTIPWSSLVASKGFLDLLQVIGLGRDDGLPYRITQDNLGVWHSAGCLVDNYTIAWSSLAIGKSASNLLQVFGLGRDDGLPYLIQQDEEGIWYAAGILTEDVTTPWSYLTTGIGKSNSLQVIGLGRDDGLPYLVYQDLQGLWHAAGRLMKDYSIPWSALATGNSNTNFLQVIGLGREDGLPYLIWQDGSGNWHNGGRLSLENDMSWSALTAGKGNANLLHVVGLGREDGLPYLIWQDDKGVWHSYGLLPLGESKLERLLKPGEVLVFNQENFKGRELLITSDSSDLDSYFPVASLRVGPQTGVTIFSEKKYQGLSQELATELTSFVGSKLQDKKPKSLRVWSSTGKPFTGYWAIEVSEGRYLSTSPDPDGVGVLKTSPTIQEWEEFQLEDRGEAGIGRRRIAVRLRREPLEYPSAAPASPNMNLNDLQNLILVEETDAGFRKFSLLTENKQWMLYKPDEDRFTTTTVDEERTIFCFSIKIADDESQVGELLQGEIALYENPNYWGKAWVFYKDYADFERVINLNDEVSSIRLGPLTGATIYREAHFTAEDRKAGKQDVVSDLPSLEKEQVGEDQISSMDLWRIVPPGGSDISLKCCLSQDFRGSGDGFMEYSAYRTTLRLSPTVKTVEVWATDETDIEVDDQTYHVDEDHSVSLKPNLIRCIVITIDAVVSPDGEDPRGTLFAPGLKIRTDTMLPNERVVIFPHQEVHGRLASLEKDQLWNASFTDKDDKVKYVIKDRTSPQKKADVANVQSMIATIMSTVRYSQGTAGSWEQSITPEGLKGKSYALDFLTYRVKVEHLYVRQGPLKTYKPVGFLQRHDIVEALSFNPDGSWIQVRRLSDGLTGWSSSKYLDKIDTPHTGDQYRVTAKGLHIRQGPDATSSSIGFLTYDEIVTVIGVNREGTWRLIRRRDGLTGWSSNRYLQLVRPPAPTLLEPVSATARSLAAAPGISDLPSAVMFHEIGQEEVQALLEQAKSPDTNLAQWSLFKEIFKGVKSAITLVVTEVENGVAIIIKTAKDVIKWIVDTAEKVVSFVEAVFEKIGAVIEDIIKWLRFLFEWKDILRTRDMLRDIILEALRYLSGPFIQEAKNRANRFIELQQDAVESFFNQAIEALGGDPNADAGGPSFMSSIVSGIADSKILDAVEWILSKISSLSKVNIFTAFKGLLEAFGVGDEGEHTEGEMDNKLRVFWKNTIVKELKTIAEIPEDLTALIMTFLNNPDKPLLTVAGMLELFRNQLVGLMDLGGDIVVTLLDLLGYLIDRFTQAISADVRIPFISDILDWIGLGGSLGFSFLDAITLVLAVPMTVFSKALYGEAPSLNVPALALGTATDEQKFFNILGGVCGYAGGIVDMGLDSLPEEDQLKTDGKVEGSSLESFFEFFSFACALGGWLSSWPIFALPDSDDSEPSDDEKVWEIVIVSYEGISILLDLFSFAYLSRLTGKFERFKRGVALTAGIATIMGGIHTLLFILKGIAIHEDIWDVTFNILPTFSEIFSYLRLPQYSNNPYVLLAIEASDFLAAGAPMAASLRNASSL